MNSLNTWLARKLTEVQATDTWQKPYDHSLDPFDVNSHFNPRRLLQLTYQSPPHPYTLLQHETDHFDRCADCRLRMIMLLKMDPMEDEHYWNLRDAENKFF